jgi:RsiW-degrading membrane proteinase PrsW (M82 family)
MHDSKATHTKTDWVLVVIFAIGMLLGLLAAYLIFVVR